MTEVKAAKQFDHESITVFPPAKAIGYEAECM